MSDDLNAGPYPEASAGRAVFLCRKWEVPVTLSL